MANHVGSEGVVKIGANTIAEVREWTLSEEANTIDDTELADTARTFKAGTTQWSGTVLCYWDETDTNGQMAMTPGATVTLNLYPEGATTGDTYYTGTAIITGVQRSAKSDGMVEAEYSFRGTGTLTKATAA